MHGHLNVKYKKKKNNCIIWHAQNTTALHPNAFLTNILVTGYKEQNGRVAPAQINAKVNLTLRSRYLYFLFWTEFSDVGNISDDCRDVWGT